MMYNNNWVGGYGYSHGMWGNDFTGGFIAPSIFGGLMVLGFILLLATIVLKGFALWNAAKRGEKWWFAALLVINTAGILELVYLIFFAKVLFKNCCGKKCDCGVCEDCKKGKKESSSEEK